MSSPGVDNCIDLSTNIDDNNNNHKKHNRFRYSGSTVKSNCCSRGGYRSFTPAKAMKMKLQKEYPPPLPSLGMEMKRYCTNDGRLIIREEKTSRPLHDMFRADRSNGRLTLHFMRFEDLNDSVLGHDDDNDVFQMDDDDQEVMPACSSFNKHAFGEQKRVAGMNLCMRGGVR